MSRASPVRDRHRAFAALALPRVGDEVHCFVRGARLPGLVMELNAGDLTVRGRWDDGTWSHWFQPAERLCL